MIPVTKSFLPPIQEYFLQVKRAFDNQWLTNRGNLVIELESRLTDYLGLEESKVICMNNGTIPLQIALRLLGNGGHVITTPFSYVATTSSIVWENCTPVFVDIHPDYLTIDETKIEAAITDKTTCILATHVFGNVCNIEAIQAIAEKNNLKVIYDAAHCFGVSYKGKSIFEFGDISTCSFHATKLFHSGEGGAIFVKDSRLYQKCFYSHNFGHYGPYEFAGIGINGKLSELHAAMGLTILPHINSILTKRKAIVDYYLSELDFGELRTFKLREESIWNYSYFPIIFKSEEVLNDVVCVLNEKNVFPRRYFYPSLNLLPYVSGTEMKNSELVSSCVLCLPLYPELEMIELREIVFIVNSTLKP